MFVLTKEQFHKAINNYRTVQTINKELKPVQVTVAPKEKVIEHIFDSLKYDNLNYRRRARN